MSEGTKSDPKNSAPDPKADPKKKAAAPTHAKECGDVGETGDHGDLGENAK
jgi:hypothetical protein